MYFHIASCIAYLSFLLFISAFPTRETWGSYIYQSPSSGGCEDVLRSRRKTGRWEDAESMCLIWDLKQFPWLNVILFLIIISEWNNSVKDKWNMKSIYVVGKATAALGELLLRMEIWTSLLNSHFFHFFPSLCVVLFFLRTLAMLMLIPAECGGTWCWQKCVKWCYYPQSFGNRLYTSGTLLWQTASVFGL